MAVNAAVKAGIHFAVAAGNDNADACNYSPAAAADAVTVGASDISDKRAYFSNYGKCVRSLWSGVNIQSTYIGSKYAVATLSGTSMASPHVAGILSYFLSLSPLPTLSLLSSGAVTPAQLKKNLIAYSSSGVLSDIPSDTPNLLIFNGAGHNISSFWNPKSAGQESEQVEHEFAILPVPDKAIAEELKRVSEDMTSLFESLAGRILGGSVLEYNDLLYDYEPLHF